MLFTYCNFKDSVSSSFLVISAYSSLSTCFRKSISGSRIEDQCDAPFFMAIFFIIVVLESSSRSLSFLFFIIMRFKGVSFAKNLKTPAKVL